MTLKKKRKKKKGPSPQKGITNERLADKLKRILREKKISKEEFARKLDEPLPYILEVLKGRRSIQLPTLIRMCKVLDVPILHFEDCIRKDDAA
ncbi:helix-turn-helix transcriptional regulator [[Clostridium] innocuum]|nr:helix-turn-helix transcriptional regulator [[Clostridium] innocuum]